MLCQTPQYTGDPIAACWRERRNEEEARGMRTRQSARVVLLNERDAVFLFRHTGRYRTYWVLPGGGVEAGETCEEAATREMWEETGIIGIPLGPLLWTRHAVNRDGSIPYIEDERYYLVRCGMPEITSENQLESEKTAYTAHGWWSLERIRASPDTFWPAGLADLLEPVIAGSLPKEPIRLPE